MSKSAEEKRQLIRNLIINIIDERKKVTKYARLLVLMRKKIKINNNILPIINIVKFYTKFLDASNSTDTERIYCFYHNIQKELFCENCQKVKVKFQSFVRGYCRHCSYACSTMDPKVRNK